MTDINKCLKLLELGFSLITIGESKKPNYSWLPEQSKPLTKSKFEKRYNYSGGHFYKNKEGEEVELPATKGVGIVTGYDYLECMDVDLKVFSTAKEQKEFWEEYLSFLEDNILDFHEKFVIVKTKNAGYHILYKTKRVEGNKKVAKLKGHKEAILETRGNGGYVFIYDNFLNNKNYSDIEFISDEDRDILFSCSYTYNYVEPVKIDVPTKSKKEFVSKPGDITPWDDFNDKNKVWDIVSEDFVIVRNLSNKYIIKRHNAESAHSGYIFKDEDLMYLHSTGTIYEAEKQYSAYTAYVRKYFNDDFSAAAKDIYQKGYGSRIVRKEQEPKEKPKVNKDNLTFPIDIFPEPVQNYLLECNNTLNNSIDYMGCSLLWLISVAIGNSIKIEVIPGWTENSTIWMSIVGKPGWGKTPSIKRIISPLLKLNSREVKRYYKDLEKFEFYDNLSKKEKEEYPETFKPKKNQFIANDITLEALVDLHQDSDNSVGVFKDELAGWFKDMNKYREGSDLEFWLSCWSGSPVILTRVTRKGSLIARPSIPILGGIQPGVLTSFSTSENKENGFLDRMLLCFPDLKSEYLSKKRISIDTISWYNDMIVNFYETIRSHAVVRNEDGEIEPRISKMSEEAYELYDQRHREITDTENDEQVNEYLKSMLPKQKAYIARFALLIHVFNDLFEDGDALVISKKSIEKAIKLSNYFIETAKKVKITSNEVSEIKKILGVNKNKNKKEQIKELWKNDPDFNRKEVAEMLEVSARTIRRYVQELEEKQ